MNHKVGLRVHLLDGVKLRCTCGWSKQLGWLPSPQDVVNAMDQHSTEVVSA